jgi:hypothetical protein
MARSVSDIHQSILNAASEEGRLGIQNTSKFARYRLFAHIVAVAIWLLEKLFDAHTIEIRRMISQDKPHILQWYVAQAKAFRFGLPFVEGSYSADHLLDEQLIVSEASAVENNGNLIIKVAKRINNQLVPLADFEKWAFLSYVNQVKDAGVKASVWTFQGDKMRLNATIWVDPMVLTHLGSRLDGQQSEPVRTAVARFVSSMPFNSMFFKQKIVDAIQQVEGVVTIELRSLEVCRYDSLAFTPVDAYYVPMSGYFDEINLAINLEYRYV